MIRQQRSDGVVGESSTILGLIQSYQVFYELSVIIYFLKQIPFFKK